MLPGLQANSSLNSQLGMQDGPALSPSSQRVSREPWPWLRSPAGVSSSFLCVPHRHCSDGCPLERGLGGQGRRALGSSPACSGGHWVLIPRLPPPRNKSPGGVGQVVGGPVPSVLQNLSCPGIGRVQS